MTTFTGNTPTEPLAALSAHVMRGGLRISRDTPRWVQRAARQLRGTPSSTIGASIESFSAGIAQRFPDVAARFTTSDEAAESYAAIDMPFVSAQGLVEVAEEEAPAFESTTAFLTHVRVAQSEVATRQPATSPTPRNTQRQSAMTPANATASSLEALRERSAAARKPATATPASPAPLQRKAELATSEGRSKPARVISAVEEVPRKNAVVRASLSPVTHATPSEMHTLPIESPQVEAPDTGPAMKDASGAPPAKQPSDMVADEAPHVTETGTASSEATQQPSAAIQRKPAAQSATQQQDDTPQQRKVEAAQAVEQYPQDTPAIQRSPRAKPVASQTPQSEAATVVRSEPAALPAPMRDDVAMSPTAPGEASNDAPIAQPRVDIASPHIQRRVDPPVPAQPNSASHTPVLPLLRKANAPQLARAGESAQQTSARIARMALPSMPSALPLSNYPATMDDDAAEATANMGAQDSWPALPDAVSGMPMMSEAMPAASFAMPVLDMPSVPRNLSAPSMRAALPQMPALPNLDMPFAQARSAAQNIGVAAQSQASEAFAALPNMPSMPSIPSLQGAASQLQTSASAAMAGGVNAASGVVQSGIAGANQIANNAVSATQGALGALNAGTAKTDLDRLARQLLPHLKRMLALERERMRPF